MDYNLLAKRAHENAVNHGFWDEKLSDEHCLMLIITEIGEAINADRKSKYAQLEGFKHTSTFITENFESYIKNTVQDELADVAIRILDLIGEWGIEFYRIENLQMFWDYTQHSFTENGFRLCEILTREDDDILNKLGVALNFLIDWTGSMNIEIETFIDLKMRYNSYRPKLHGKKY